MNPKVSILVPIYNVESFIERCVVSLFEQTFDDIEYIFVNDCTLDESIEVLQKVVDKYPNRKPNVKIINHEVNKGLAGARNTAVANAKGQYILHVDSDDYIERNAVEVLYDKAKVEHADIVVSDFILEWEKVNKFAKQKIGNNRKDYLNLMLSASTIVGVVNKLIKRELYVKNQIKAIEGINLGEDYLTTPKLVYFANKVSKVDFPLYHYLQTNSNSYTKNYNKKNIQNVISVMKELTSFFEKKQDYDLYKNSILQGKLRKKIEIIFNTEVKYWNDLFNIFPETKQLRNKEFLSNREKIIYYFITNNNYFGLLCYKKFYNSLFNLVQKLKGR